LARTSERKKKDQDLFINREVSWLAFNERVLEEAVDATNPLLERLKFTCIASSNLDEFFMVRVAALKHAVAQSEAASDPSGLSFPQQLSAISERAHASVDRLYETLTSAILPALAERGIRIVTPDGLEAPARAALSRQFQEEILPALTPLAIDSSRPFPMLANLSLNLALLLSPPDGEEQPRLAVVQVPSRLPRLVRPVGGDGTTYVLLDELIRSELRVLFPGQEIVEAAVFRITRDAELDLDDEGGRGFLQVIEEELQNRRRSQVVRLEVESGVGEGLLEILSGRLQVAGEDLYRIRGPLDVRAFFFLVDLPTLEDLRNRPLKPLPALNEAESEDIFETLERGDVLLHHPYESFDAVISFVSRAAEDPDVLAIKQTLYRTGGQSPVVQALARAAEAGKQVTVLVELTARFDEESNIQWARKLEQAGAHVIYGIRGYKTHSKICLVVRRGRDGIRRYVHLGTGNYNDRTARLYTDFGLMTADGDIGQDASSFFNALTGYSDPPRMKKLAMAPTQLREKILKLIERETRRAEAGQPAEIRAKMNALVDPDIIQALYDASSAGVQIRLGVRGVCCLRPGLKGVSETIQVVSIVDRFLEHERIYTFRNGGDLDVYLASADWMPRNLDKRVELLFPVESPEGQQKVLRALDALFQDTVKARQLQSDGSYKRRKPQKGEEPFRSQISLYEETRARLRGAGAAIVLEPLTSPEPR
jgi:polyphosphate kinase